LADENEFITPADGYFRYSFGNDNITLSVYDINPGEVFCNVFTDKYNSRISELEQG